MGRVAAFLILLSQTLLIWVAFEPSGTSAIWFSFVGTPLLFGGCVLGLVALRRRVRDLRSQPVSTPEGTTSIRPSEPR
jgi:hypothetical protein